MPKSVNEVILVGTVGKDPEVRYSQNGTPVASFSLATNERFKDRNDEWQDRTEWHNIVAWQRLPEIVGGVRCKRIQGVHRRQAPDHKLGGSAERGEEISH